MTTLIILLSISAFGSEKSDAEICRNQVEKHSKEYHITLSEGLNIGGRTDLIMIHLTPYYGGSQIVRYCHVDRKDKRVRLTSNIRKALSY